MVFEQIEKQKREYTDKYVVVDATRPELARFKDVVGQVKTVNMSGRALVEFLDYHLNIGWYDIDPQFLKVVDKPPPKPAKPEEKKPAKAEAKPAAAKTPAKTPVAAPKAGKPSVADILAAARAGKPATGAAASAAVKKKSEPDPADTGPPGASPAKVDRSKMSVADMLAAARAGGAAGAAKAQAKPEPSTQPPPAPPVPDGAAALAAVAPAEIAPPKASEKIDRSKMSIDDILAWCRQHDAK
jgi:hypothetical protein